ncbi:MAG: hypothetical protein ABIC40_06205, partial [bacterium]
QGIFSQGDRGLTEYFEQISRSRGPIISSWNTVMHALGDSPEEKVLNSRGIDEELPWSFIRRIRHDK